MDCPGRSWSNPRFHPFGDFVRVSGIVTDSVVSLGYSYTKSVNILKVQDYSIEQDTHKLLNYARIDYQTAKVQLKKQAAPAESKLVWPNEPEWQLFIDEQRSNGVLYFSTADLMYAADINFVYDLKSYNLVQVYAQEWFKGE